MTRLIIAAMLAILASTSASRAETEVIIRDDKKVTIRHTPPKTTQPETSKEPSEAEVNSLTNDETNYIWNSLSSSERIAYKRGGTRNFDALPMAEKKKLVKNWSEKKNTKVHIISPGRPEQKNSQ